MINTLQELNNEWVEKVSKLLVGRTITKVERFDVPSGVCSEDIIQGYAKLKLDNGSNILMGVDYEECEFLVCEVDDSNYPITRVEDVIPGVE